MILDSMNQPRRPPARSQTFSDAPHYEERFERVPPKVISLIDLSSEERNEHNPPTNRLIEQVWINPSFNPTVNSFPPRRSLDVLKKVKIPSTVMDPVIIIFIDRQIVVSLL